jgi:TolB-like protein
MTSRINAARKAIGDSGEAQSLIRTVPRRGIRFVGAVREEQEPAAPVDARAVTANPPRPALALLDKPSIAVLPFVNLSGDPEQDYFADGMVEEIITALSRIGGLFVVARNSTFTYKGRAVDVKQVGRELGVRYVLEGSIRKGRQRVRIAAQLIEAATDAHLWAAISMGRWKMYSSCRTKSRSVLPASSSRHCKPQRSNSRWVGRPRTLPPTNSICALSHPLRKAGTTNKSSRFSATSGRRSSATRPTGQPSAWRRFAARTSTSPAGPTTRRRTALPALR